MLSKNAILDKSVKISLFFNWLVSKKRSKLNPCAACTGHFVDYKCWVHFPSAQRKIERVDRKLKIKDLPPTALFPIQSIGSHASESPLKIRSI